MENGPTPDSVRKIAIADTMSIVVAVSRGPKRNATQIITGQSRTVSGQCRDGNTPPKSDSVTSAAMTASATASTTWRRLNTGPSLTPIQRISVGAMTMSLTASPSHHVSHTRGASSVDTRPPNASEVTPIDAATVVLTIAASSVNRMMSRTRSNTRPPRAKRLTRYAASSPSIVLPTAMPSDGKTAPVVEIFAKNAPAKIAGQTP